MSENSKFSIDRALYLRRRDVLALAGYALANAILTSAANAEEGASEDAAAGQSSTATDHESERIDDTTTDVASETSRTDRPTIDLRNQLGLSSRAPQLAYEDGWSILGEFAGSRDSVSQRQGGFFVDSANQTLMSPEGSPLDSAFRWILPNIPEASSTAADSTRRLDEPIDHVEDSLSSKLVQAYEAVEWANLGRATLDKAGEIAVDYTKEFTLDRIADVLGTQVMNKWFGAFSLVIDVIKPEALNGGRKEELSYIDRMSPAERRDFFHEVMTRRVQFPTTLPPTGPTMHAPR